MGLTGRIEYKNLSAVQIGEDGSVDYGKPPVEFGDTVVPARVGYIIEGDRSSPSLRIEFEIRDGEPFCASVQVNASERGRSIRTGDLTALPSLERLAVEAFSELAMRARTKTPFAAHIGADREGRKRARLDVKTRGDAELKEVARVYRENVDGRPRQAVEDLGYSPRTASRRIDAARERGFLPKTSQGKRKA